MVLINIELLAELSLIGVFLAKGFNLQTEMQHFAVDNRELTDVVDGFTFGDFA